MGELHIGIGSRPVQVGAQASVRPQWPSAATGASSRPGLPQLGTPRRAPRRLETVQVRLSRTWTGGRRKKRQEDAYLGIIGSTKQKKMAKTERIIEIELVIN